MGLFKSIGKAFKKVFSVAKKILPVVLAAAAIVYTAGSALSLGWAAGGWTKAAASLATSFGATGTLGSVVAGALTHAGYGAVIGGVASGVMGGDVIGGMQKGALAGAVTGGITGGMTPDASSFGQATDGLKLQPSTTLSAPGTSSAAMSQSAANAAPTASGLKLSGMAAGGPTATQYASTTAPAGATVTAQAAQGVADAISSQGWKNAAIQGGLGMLQGMGKSPEVEAAEIKAQQEREMFDRSQMSYIPGSGTPIQSASFAPSQPQTLGMMAQPQAVKPRTTLKWINNAWHSVSV